MRREYLVTRCEIPSLLNYRPQTKFPKVMFSQVSVCPQGRVCIPACTGQGVCIPACIGQGMYPSMHWAEGCARGDQRQTPPGPEADTLPRRILRNTVNKRAVRIPLECILVLKNKHTKKLFC